MRKESQHRSKSAPRRPVLRIGIAALALVLGYISVTQTLAFTILKSSAERAYSLSANDGRIIARLAEQLSAGEVTSTQRIRANRLAHRALLEEPLAVPAVTALALNSQMDGATNTARALFTHSNTLSRRELGARIWLIEDAVARGDIREALQNYDIALRTSRSASGILFPILASSITDPSIAEAVATTLAKRPPWGEAFIGYVADSGTPPTATAGLFRRLVRRGITPSPIAQAAIVNALVSAGALDEAWSYYHSLHADADRRRSRDPDFASQTEATSVFDWVPTVSDAGVSSSIQPTQNGNVFDFAVSATVGSVVLQQTQLLPPGRYKLESASVGIAQPAVSKPYWQLTCATGQELGRLDLPNSAENGGRFMGEFIVGGNCPVQVLRLVVRPSTEIGGVTGQIEHAKLAPIGGHQ